MGDGNLFSGSRQDLDGLVLQDPKYRMGGWPKSPNTSYDPRLILTSGERALNVNALNVRNTRCELCPALENLFPCGLPSRSWPLIPP